MIRSFCKLAAFGLMAIILGSIISAMAAANTVPPTGIGDITLPVDIVEPTPTPTSTQKANLLLVVVKNQHRPAHLRRRPVRVIITIPQQHWRGYHWGKGYG
jgi:hypothetical protein